MREEDQKRSADATVHSSANEVYSFALESLIVGAAVFPLRLLSVGASRAAFQWPYEYGRDDKGATSDSFDAM